jgi:hypothetical protein
LDSDEKYPFKIAFFLIDMRWLKQKSNVEYMSIELQNPVADLRLQEEEKSERLKNIEQEIECPRCNNVMTLTSDFDTLGYVCQECDLLLVVK